MTNISGNKKVVVDSDALIGLIHEDDLLHKKSLSISKYLADHNFHIVVSYPIVLEAATALAKDRNIRRPDLARQLLYDYASYKDDDVNTEEIPALVAKLYHEKTSKKNSPFDYYLLALAKKNNIQLIFSFDSFYKKRGLTLVAELL